MDGVRKADLMDLGGTVGGGGRRVSAGKVRIKGKRREKPFPLRECEEALRGRLVLIKDLWVGLEAPSECDLRI